MSRAATIVGIGIGVTLLLVSFVLYVRSHREQQPPAASTPENTEFHKVQPPLPPNSLDFQSAAEAAGRAAQNERIEQLAATVTELQSELRAARNHRAPGDNTRPPVAATPEQIAETKKRHIEAHEQALRAHDAETVDPRWAPRAMAAFREDFQRSAIKIGADILGADCRTTSCVVRFRWPNYEAARENFNKAMHAPLQMSCAKEITIPEPSDPTQPYEAEMVFDCTTSRTAQ